MKKKFAIIIAITICLAIILSACTFGDTSTVNATPSQSSDAITTEAASDTLFTEVTEANGDFTLTTEDGEYSESNGIYTLTKGGTYTATGYLNGQIIIDAADEKVTLELKSATIVCSTDSPIKVLSADKVEISAKKDTDNVIKDTRSNKTTDVDSLGEGAIYAKCDLEIKGNGILVVEGNYNSGIHTTKDLKIKNLSLKVTAVGNALKGNDSVTLESGTIVAISTKGNGIKTENSDVSSGGKQRGTITVNEAAVAVYAAGDGIEASYDFVMNDGNLTIYTGSYSAYTASGANTTSYKGVKAGNELTVKGGAITIYSYDDGLHADYGTTLENGQKSKGNINVSGGAITVSVYSPTKSTAMGRPGPRGWNSQQSVSGADAIHADNTLTISGGTINVDSAYEGLEANYIKISGGTTYVYATDDGINAYKNIGTPSITVLGGYLDVTVPSNGDTDGIDSNGTYTQTGGVVVAKGPGSASGGMGGGAWALDADGAITLQGGTLILFGGMERTPSASGMTKSTCSSSTVSTGDHIVTVGGNSYTINLKYSTSGCVVYSENGKATLK